MINETEILKRTAKKKKKNKTVKEKLEVQNVLRYDGDELECKIQNYLKAVRLRRQQVKFAIAIAIAEALIKSNLYYILYMLGLASSFWVPSLF